MPPRGRAASPIRPGLICKQVLQGTLPLDSGEHATEASINDTHSAYKVFLGKYNQLRPHAKQIKGMNHSSWYTMFKFAQLLGLVELVREEPMLYPPPGGNLYSVRKTGERARAVVSKRRIFRLTSTGQEDEKSWLDLTRAWKEQWSVPQKVEYLPSLSLEEIIVEKPPPKPEVKPPPEVVLEAPPVEVKRRRGRPLKVLEVVPEIIPEAPIPEFEWVVKPSQKQYRLLLEHLEVLAKLDQARLDVTSHIDYLATRIGDWAVEIDDALEDAKLLSNIRLVSRLTHEKWLVNDVYEGLVDRDLDKAIVALRKLTGK